MFGYYLQLAIRSLRRNVVLTALMIAAVAVGIGAAMTALTTLRAMSGDPIPDRSSQLFVPQIDAWGPDSRHDHPTDHLNDQLSYRDAMAFMRAHQGVRQTAMYSVAMDVSPQQDKPFSATGRATYADFFGMFEVPFRSGGPWSSADDAGHTNVVVLSAKLADRVFPNIDPVGRTISLDARDYRVVGVLEPWNPTPRFYDVTGLAFMNAEDFYLPFNTAIDRHLESNGNNSCNVLPAPGWDGHLNSECVWLQFWVELPTAAAVRDYRNFLANYAAEQRRSGRFHWPDRVELHDVHDWLVLEKVVPDEMKVNTLIGMGFLVVCLINAIGLMLARFARRAGELGVRRALGGSRSDIFLQCLTETAVVGLLGGVLGLALTAAGLAADRALLAPQAEYLALNSLTRLDWGMVGITLSVAVLATLGAGVYPTWRASRVQPAWQLKAQ
ncbi:MAG TPA: ABC transporter permease [Steroidobacteraceae bacterium]|nr:ABC transporter permease [Steroidobacteraceae bacterium]